MMNPVYEVITTTTGNTVINATYEDGRMLSIPMNEDNSDYQAYLNKDKAEQSTPIPTE
jgi:hypothetical protein